MKRPLRVDFNEFRGRTPWLEFLLLIAVLLLGGCTVGPKYHTPVTEIPTAYKEAGNWKPAQPNDQNLGGDWWTIFRVGNSAAGVCPSSAP